MKLKENKTIKMLFCILSVVLIWGIYAVMVKWVRWEVEKEKVVVAKVEEDANVLLDVSKVYESNGKLKICGWIMREASDVTDVKVILKEAEGTEEQVAETVLTESRELEQYIEYLEVQKDYGSGGFEANIKVDRLRENSCYEIFLYFSYETEKEGKNGDIEKSEVWKKIATGWYVCGRKLYRYNLMEFSAPEFTEEQMKQVVVNGIVCAYDSEKKVWVYLYNGSLYWIVDQEINEVYENTRKVYFHLYSSNLEKLPENRQKNGFDNQDFFFEKKQVFMDEQTNYAVAKVSLEMEYPVTYIKTGLFDVVSGKNFWDLKFQYPSKQ